MELNFFKLIWQASPLVQIVIALLAGASVLSWAAIAFKLRELRGAEQDSEAFLAAYHQGTFEDSEKAARANPKSPLSTVMLAAVVELKHIARYRGRGEDGFDAGQLRTVNKAINWAGSQEALRLALGARPRRPAWPLIDRTWPGRAAALALARRRTMRQTGGQYPAPMAAIEVMRYGLSRSLERGLEREAEVLGQLLVGDVSRHLVGIFLSSRASASSFDGGSRPVQRLGVLGAGTMGGGIAALAAMAGLPVRLKDVSAEALARGMKQVHARASEAARKGRIPRHQAALREALVSTTVDSSGFAHCDVIIEALAD